jgi:hypothetical protein
VGAQCTLGFGGAEGERCTSDLFLLPASQVRNPVLVEYIDRRRDDARLTILVRDPRGRDVPRVQLDLVEVDSGGRRIRPINLPVQSSVPADVKPGRYAVLLDGLGLPSMVQKTVDVPAGPSTIELGIGVELTRARVSVLLADGSTPSYCVVTIRSGIDGEEEAKTFRTMRPERLDMLLPCGPISFEVWVKGYPKGTAKQQMVWSSELQSIRLEVPKPR